MNNDNIPDSTQPGVTTYINTVVGGYVSIVTTGDCTQITEASFHLESALPTQDNDHDYYIGLHGMKLECSVFGGTATVTYYWDQDYDISYWQYRKYLYNSQQYINFDSQVSYGTANVGGANGNKGRNGLTPPV